MLGNQKSDHPRLDYFGLSSPSHTKADMPRFQVAPSAALDVDMEIENLDTHVSIQSGGSRLAVASTIPPRQNMVPNPAQARATGPHVNPDGTSKLTRVTPGSHEPESPLSTNYAGYTVSTGLCLTYSNKHEMLYWLKDAGVDITGQEDKTGEEIANFILETRQRRKVNGSIAHPGIAATRPTKKGTKKAHNDEAAHGQEADAENAVTITPEEAILKAKGRTTSTTSGSTCPRLHAR